MNAMQHRSISQIKYPAFSQCFFLHLLDANSFSGFRCGSATGRPRTLRPPPRRALAPPVSARGDGRSGRSLRPLLPSSLPPGPAAAARPQAAGSRAGWRCGCGCCWLFVGCSLPAGRRQWRSRRRERGSPAGGGGWAPRRASPSSTTATPSCGRRWWPCGCSARPSAGSTQWGAAPRAESCWSSRSPTAPASMSPVRRTAAAGGRRPSPHLAAGSGGVERSGAAALCRGPAAAGGRFP